MVDYKTKIVILDDGATYGALAGSLLIEATDDEIFKIFDQGFEFSTKVIGIQQLEVHEVTELYGYE